ncbi:hypothetical protein [Longimicrobium sp.]|jgi:hypothetical protein|uniref:hypothetical protein n=1 Tax=Longimicrobium sp. TaxID=2029185 RepID=UPI002F945594
MTRKLILLLAVALQSSLAACTPVIRNCPVIGKDPLSNVYHLDYQLIIPADCPVPLASPGTEKKYAAARVYDLGDVDFFEATVTIKNSKGETLAEDASFFFGGIAEPSDEYIAATGKKTFDDYDVGTFRAFSSDFSKTAYGQTKLTYQQSSLATKLTGTVIPSPNTTHTWYAPTSGGTPGYMYQWYRDGSPVGNGSSYTGNAGTTDFDLRVEVTDQTWSTRAAVLAADVGGVQALMDGPTLVYSSQNGGSWTASGLGGTGSYTFNWYLDGQWVGSGAVWSGYTGESGHNLQVQMRDGAGAFDSESVFVTGIGSGDGTCEPVPPAVTC